MKQGDLGQVSLVIFFLLLIFVDYFTQAFNSGNGDNFH